MAKKYPYMKFYPGDFASDDKVDAMCNRELGAYMRLFCKAWHQDPAGTLPDDDAKLAAWAREPLKSWRKMKVAVMAPFILSDDGRWHQKRMKQERAHLERKSHQATKAVRTRYGESTDVGTDVGVSKAFRTAIPESESEPESERTTTADANLDAAVDRFASWAARPLRSDERRRVAELVTHVEQGEAVTVGDQLVPPMSLLLDAIGEGIERATYHGIGPACQYVTAVLHRCRENGCRPGQWPDKAAKPTAGVVSPEAAAAAAVARRQQRTQQQREAS